MASTKLPHRQLGRNGPSVSAIGLGTMGVGAYYGKTDEAEAIKGLTYAADRGMTFWDTGDIYGTSEATLGKWFEHTGRRSEIFLATKFGAYNLDGNPRDGAISKPSYVRKAFLRSLSQLKTEYVDLYYQHRVDPKVPIEIVLETLREFVDKGQIKWIGLSECNSETLRRAKAVEGLGDKVIAAQMEFSPFSLDIEKNGLAQTADELGVSIVAYSPLGRGLVTGKFRSRADFEENDLRLVLPRWSEENFPKNLEVVDKIKLIADRFHSSSSQVTLAWILAEHPTWIPIPGSRTPERIEENARGAELKLTPEAVKEIRDLTEKAEVSGERYGSLMSVDGGCIPLEEWKGE